MKISDNLENLPPTQQGTAPPSPPTSKPSAPTLSSNRQHSPDAVEFSSETTEYQQVLKQIDREPELRHDRIERLQKEIAKGSYRVHSKQITKRLLRETLLNELATKNSPDTSRDAHDR